MGRRHRLALAALLAAAGFAAPAAAHGASFSTAGDRSLSVPIWLFLSTGGGVVGASFVLASFVTDRSFIRRIHAWRRGGAVPLERGLRVLGRAIGVAGLAFVLVVGFLGPRDPTQNAAVLTVWVGWWSGFTMSTYLVGNAWPALNPWRTLAGALPSPAFEYPERFDAWPSVVGLLALVWLEVVSPVADRPRVLAVVVAGYTVLTLAGAAAFGTDVWFGRVDPISRVFRYFGRIAPLYYDDGLRLRLPGAGLDEPELVTSRAEVAFVVAILWATTYDGLVATPLWRRLAIDAVESGFPPGLLYPVALVAGYLAVLGVYAAAVHRSKQRAESYLPADVLGRRFAPSLLAIAAGYHLAHFLGYFLELTPSLLSAGLAPLSPPAPVALVLPAWFGGVELAAVVLGHLLAIWVAHAVAYEVFPGKLQAVRSQYAVTAAMVCYTMASLWVVSQPYAVPPYIS